MLYCFTDAAGQTCGPVEVDALHAAIRDGTLTPETLAVEEGGTEWKPLAALLRYYYSDGGEVLGPVRLAELPVFAAAARDGEFLVLPEGGAEWVPFGIMPQTPAAGKASHVPAYVPPPIQRPPARPVPSAARTAGVLWAIFGILKLCESILALFQVHRLPAEARGFILAVLGLHFLIALLFLNAGIKTATGRAHDFGGYARVSLVFGLLGIVLLILRPDNYPLDLWTLGGILLLLTSGNLAISGREDYRDWKAGRPAARGTKHARRK